ncbi:hypothetical protein OAD26_00160 [bacterium]|nr:hypothetical protein [bacterium]
MFERVNAKKLDADLEQESEKNIAEGSRETAKKLEIANENLRYESEKARLENEFELNLKLLREDHEKELKIIQSRSHY